MGRLPSHGVAWYRKKLNITSTEEGKSIYIEIDGAMAYAMVWLNGKLVGGWPYGYNSFRLDKDENFKKFSVKKLTNSVKITSDFTDNLSDRLMKNRRKIVSLAKERYIQLQAVYEKRYSLLFDRIIGYVADLDVGVSSSKVAHMYNIQDR